jgi:DNA-binding CsgD family transcriptional regulator
MVSWDDLTPEERESYVNQDYVPRKYILVNVETFDKDRYNIASIYDDIHIPEYCVQEMLATLTPRQREVISTIYLDGNTQEMAASILGISRRALRTHLDRARIRLRKCSHFFKENR